MPNVQYCVQSKPLTRQLVGILFGMALAAIAPPARAEVCFPTPVAVPGLSGVPLWEGAGTIRPELNEPRWAAAPRTGFASDPTGKEGLYRIIVDPAYSELNVSFQAPTDLGSPSAADAIYFGFTMDGMGGNAAKGVAIQVNGLGATDPMAATGFQQHNYDVAAVPQWTAPPVAPAWLESAFVWRNNVAGDAAWGINFKVDLTAAGLSANPFRIMLAMHKQDELSVTNSVNVSTPDPALNALLPGTLFVADPTKWAAAAAINSGCSGGITISSAQIGTRTVVSGSPAPSEINTANGAVNRFFATPTVPGSIPLFPGLFQAKFHLANWASASAPNAPWTPVPNDTVVLNGIAPASSDGSIEFDCPANTATTTCGLPTPSITHQAMYVELMAAPGQTVPFTTAAAYRDVDFTPPASNGGASSGGASGAGGAIGSGGAPSGGNGTGGTAGAGGNPSGGASSVSGGASNVSGAPSDSVAGASAGMSAQTGGAGDAGDAATDSAGAPGNAGAGSAPNGTDKGGTCGCRIVGRESSTFAELFALLVVGVSVSRRRRARHAS